MYPDAATRLVTPLRTWLIALGLWLALATVASIALWHLRRDALKGQTRELGLLSVALTDAIARGLQGADEGLRAVRAELSEGRLPLNGPEAVRALRVRAELMPLIQSLWLVDREGQVISASDATPVPGLTSFLPQLNELVNDSTAVSLPFMDVGANQTRVALASRFADAPGTSGGWIVAALPASALLGAFSAALPAADARMAVYRSDGALLAGINVPVSHLDEAGFVQRLAHRPSIEVRRFRDGSENLVGLQSVPLYGIKVVVSRDLDTALESWRGAADLSAAALLLLLVIMAVSVHVALRADRRRTLAQLALQAQRSRASKLESLGTLAGGVAHDFNNVLAGIVGFGEMAHDAAPPGSDQARHLDRVLQAAWRGKALVERVLAFSRGGARASIVFELEPVVDEVLAMLSASLRPGIVLEREFRAQGARLRGDPTQAFKAITNLCTNAMQAMPAGGMLSIRLERTHTTAPRVLSHSQLSAGEYIVLSVSDQGSGITPEAMERLFEPFFTTRSAQSGTGLGLAVVFGVAAEFGGAIGVTSTPGYGACFTLYFPESKEDVEFAEPSLHVAPSGAGQRLLVIDDEPELLALVKEMLKGLGYDPVGYSDSTAALQALNADPTRFAAVITDEVMPGLSGTKLTQALRQRAPHLPVLLVSGYGGASLGQRAAAAGVTRVLTKPLRRSDLAQALAVLLS